MTPRLPATMKRPPSLQFRQSGTWSILLAVGLLGMLFTLWVTREAAESAQERLEQRFQIAAKGRADLVKERLLGQLDQLTTLQRLFRSVGDVRWPVFEKFVEPLLNQKGVRGFGWMPLVEARDVGAFERAGRLLWGEDFALSEPDPQGGIGPIAAHERYYPVYYAAPLGPNRKAIGLNLHAAANRRSLIDRAVDTSLPTASEPSPLIIDRQQADTVVVMAPVYRSFEPPPDRAERRAGVRGIVMAVLSIGTLFDEINAGAIDVGLHVSLLDKRIDASDQLLRVWHSKLADTDHWPATPLQYEHAFEFADRQWTVRVEASPAWVRAHASRSAPLVPLGGALLTLFLLIYLQQTLVRRARAEALVASQSSDLVERERAYETLVEHLPDVVCRFDRHSRYVFANAAFERSLGLSHEAIRGKTVREAFSDYPGINPALIDCWEHVLRRLHETGEAERIEFGFPGDDGPRFFDGILVIEAATETTGETVLVILH